MDEILKDYFVKGFLYQKILQLLEKFHGINISMRTLQQRLHSLCLKRKKIDYIKGKYIYYAEGGGDEDVKGGHRNIFWH